jgi:Protein of unknown function (DUF3027)
MTVVATRPKPDATLVAAVEVAREAALVDAGADAVGEHLGAVAEPDVERVVTHRFASLSPGYRGWVWAVTLSRVSRGKAVTVDEVVQLPGEDALLAPAWVPWAERLQPGDLGPGDLLPTDPDDARLLPGFRFEADDEPEVLDVVLELGLGRRRVLSPEGRDEAADRWINGPGGPHAELAEAAPASCDTCGFLVHLGGAIGRVFGVCANEWSPSDGIVVSMDHGCGAHSEGAAAAVQTRSVSEAVSPVVDETGYDDLGHS